MATEKEKPEKDSGKKTPENPRRTGAGRGPKGGNGGAR